MDIGLVAGEASGDLLGAHFVNALKHAHPDLRAAGIAGPKLVQAGVEAIYPSEKLAVNGYIEVLRHLPELLWIRSRITRHFLSERPRVFVGIDAPDFNFALEARLKQAGIPTVHFVSPSLWAWRPERIHRIKQAVSHMLVVFPFEEKIYQDAGIPVTYVGHPLADVIPLVPDGAAARATLALALAAGPVVALLPGSRLSEVRRHAQLMLDAAALILQQHPDAQFVLPAASDATAQLIRRVAQGRPLPLHILKGQSHTALAACDVALVASGTATLEAALFKKPMVITYRVPALTAYLMRKKALLPWIGLPNILARDFVVPERVQEAATPEHLAADALAWLVDAPRCQALATTFHAMHVSLRQNASLRIAEALAPYLVDA
ncbi:MAG: lipid-A-disaccharide synthase [Thiobacillus sp.]|nr:lipid-A-disaccharide synthase [Thiobacillus sp.]